MGTSKSFRQSVVEKTKQQTWEFLGKTPRSILLDISSIVVAAAAKFFFGISAMNALIVEIIVDILAGSILFLIGLSVVNLIRAPRLVYYDQQKEIEKLRDKYERPPEIIIEPRAYPALGQPKFACLTLRNDSKTKDIVNLRVKLTSLEYIRDGSLGMLALDPNSLILNKVDRISANDEVKIDIAEDRDHRLTLLFDDDKSPTSISKINRQVIVKEESAFRVGVEISGMLEGGSVNTFPFTGNVALSKTLPDDLDKDVEFGLPFTISWVTFEKVNAPQSHG